MAKGGPLQFLLPAALGVGALASGGLGLPALLGDIGATAGAEAGGVGAEALLGAEAPGILGGEAAVTEAPLAAGSAAFGLPTAEVTGLPSAISGLTDAAAPIEAGAVGSLTNPAPTGTANLFSVTSDTAPNLSAGVPGATPVTTSPLGAVDAAGQPIASAVGAADPSSTLGGTLGPYGADLTGTADASGGGVGGFAKDIFGDVGGLKGLTGILAAGLLGSELLKGNPQYPEQKTLGGQAAGYNTLGNQLTLPLTTGALPTGAESAIDLSTSAQKAHTANTYANLGLSGSTMEAEAINAVDQQASAQKFGIAEGLLRDAFQYSNLGTHTTENLLKTSMLEDEQYRAALANFARALAGTQGVAGALPGA